MAKDTEYKFSSAGGTWPREGVLLQDHVQAQHPSFNIDWANLSNNEEHGEELGISVE